MKELVLGTVLRLKNAKRKPPTNKKAQSFPSKIQSNEKDP